MASSFTYGGQTILSHPIFVETILPFVLVFTIVFAVLQKAKVFGDGKRQIDALVALVIGLLVISFANATGFIVQLVPFLAVSLVVLIVLMILIGSFFKGSGDWPKGITYPLIIVAILAVVIAVVYITGVWQYIRDMIYTSGGSGIFINVVFIIIIAAAVVAVILSSKSK